MRALLRTASVALSMLLLSTSTSSAQGPAPGDPNTEGCPVISIRPVTEMCPGWEAMGNCSKTVVTVVIENTSACTISDIRISPMPHMQGTTFGVCAPGYEPLRHGCAGDVLHIAMRDRILKPGDLMTFQLFASREGEFMIEMLCPEESKLCSMPLHVPAFPSPYPAPRDPSTPTDPTTPTNPLLPGGPSGPVNQDPVVPGSTTNEGVIPMPQQQRPATTGSNGAVLPGGGSGTGVIGGE